MLIVLALITIAVSIVFAVSKNNRRDTVPASIITSIILTAVISITIGVSYSTYLDTRAQYDAVINQYKGAVTMYADYASLDMEKAAFTDFKYQGYQENVAAVIIDLRKEMISYNRVLIQKRIMDKNPVFSWLIIAPDKDMKIINIVE
jgi:hypothetical protein